MVEGASQKIVNHLIDDLFQKNGTLAEINWYRIPRQAEVLMDPPWGHVFATDKSHTQHGYQDIYEYEQAIDVMVGWPQQQPQDEERLIHVIEEAVEDLIIKNRQPVITGLNVFDMQVVRSDYVSPGESGFAVDTLLMQINVSYTRVVTA